jgi:hypothetical protein
VAVGLIVMAAGSRLLADVRDEVPPPVGPELLFDQTDQDCAGYWYVDSYASALGFLTAVEGQVCYSDGTPPTPEFVGTGWAHLYWLDQVPGDGNLINGVDLKYWTTTAGPNTVCVHFRQGVYLPSGDAGTAIHPPATYVMTVPGGAGQFIRMVLPSDWEIAHGAVPGYFVGDLISPTLPVGPDYDSIVPGTGVWTPMPSWRTTAAVAGDHFGVAMSFNEGWDDNDATQEPTMGWFLA